MKARCPFCGKVYDAPTRAKLAYLARRHLLLPGPCSDAMVTRIVEGKHGDERGKQK